VLLVEDLSNLTSTYCTTTFTDCEFQSFFHRYSVDQFNLDCYVITWHNHFSSFR